MYLLQYRITYYSSSIYYNVTIQQKERLSPELSENYTMIRLLKAFHESVLAALGEGQVCYYHSCYCYYYYY